MTQLAVQRCVSADLVLDFATVTASLVLHVKALFRVVYTVRVTLLPLVLPFGAVGLLVAGRMVFTRLVVRSILESLLLGDLGNVRV